MVPALVALVWQPAPQSGPQYALAFKPPVGAVARYEMTMKGADGEGFSAVAQIEQRVTRVGTVGYTVESASLGALVRINGSETRDERENRTVIEYGPNGAVLKVTKASDKSATFRNAVLTRFVSPPAPVEVGSSWRQSYPVSNGFKGATIDYRFISLEGGVAKVGFEFSEGIGQSLAKGKGEFAVRVPSGQVASFTVAMEGQAAHGPQVSSITMRLVD